MAGKKVAARAVPTLRSKVEEALSALIVGDDARLELEDVKPDKVAGTIISAVFEKKTPSERQDMIWERLDEALTPHERTRIVIILAETPHEHQTLRDDAPAPAEARKGRKR